jgi:hypothetical protein
MPQMTATPITINTMNMYATGQQSGMDSSARKATKQLKHRHFDAIVGIKHVYTAFQLPGNFNQPKPQHHIITPIRMPQLTAASALSVNEGKVKVEAADMTQFATKSPAANMHAIKQLIHKHKRKRKENFTVKKENSEPYLACPPWNVSPQTPIVGSADHNSSQHMSHATHMLQSDTKENECALPIAEFAPTETDVHLLLGMRTILQTR